MSDRHKKAARALNTLKVENEFEDCIVDGLD